MSITRHTEHGTLPALDGRQIPYLFDRTSRPISRGVFLLLHGLGVDKNEYHDFYRTMSAMLSHAGYDVLRIDFPAHGDSTAESSCFTLINCIADAITAGHFAIQHSGQPALSVFGTSFGAGPAVVTASFFQDALKSVTLLAPAISYPDLYITPIHPQRLETYAGFYQGALLNGASIRIDERVALSWRNALEFALMNLDHDLATIASRTAVIHGASDSMVPHELSRDLVSRFPGLHLTIVPGMDHGFMDQDDEDGSGDQSKRNLRLIYETAIR
ncbi:MAG: alpha/beta fold hydrolase [Phycisphaerales bacterium]|nr:alpha/beta fold hydrolase [Phycisphaerales bacterium]